MLRLLPRRLYVEGRGKRLFVTTPILSAVADLKPHFDQLKPRTSAERSAQNQGLFLIPPLTTHEGFTTLREVMHQRVKALVTEATGIDRRRPMVAVFDDLSDEICRVADMASFVQQNHPDAHYRTEAEQTCIEVMNLVESLNTNQGLYGSLKHVVEQGDEHPTDDIDQRVASLFLEDFYSSGVHLGGQERANFIKLTEAALILGNQFQLSAQSPRRVNKDSLPHRLRSLFSAGASIHSHGMSPYDHSEKAREASYRAYLSPDSDCEALLTRLLLTRASLARLAGFESFSHRALKLTLGDVPEDVSTFLDSLSHKLRPFVDKEYASLVRLKGGSRSAGDLRPWDMSYYSAIARHQCCELDSEKISQYFSLGNCMEGISGLLTSLYGIHLRVTQPDPGEVWHSSICKLVVVHESKGELGVIYCDFFDREGKPRQDCHYTIQGGRQLPDQYQKPIVALSMTFPSPSSSKPSLLTPQMVDNLFHEFGHAMHSMLGRTRYQHVTGTRCPTDFAEIPAVLMEYFASDHRVLSTFAFHYADGSPISSGLLQDVCTAKRMLPALELQRQTFHSKLDQEYHCRDPLATSTTDTLQRVQAQYSCVPYVEDTAWQLRFSHLNTYGGKYYSYLYSRAVAAQIWEKLFKEDPFSRSQGELYQRDLLAHGGGMPPALLVGHVTGRTPTPQSLVDSIIEELSSSTP